ncbi:MAG: ParB/RepB/Spo0J family partition protein [Sinobacteraceae bacterium]|nr:ParB/RepB/Spo0J family partition protein [Nevskiaceae bacterium]
MRPDRSQARHNFNPERLAELAESIAESGVIQPVIVRPIGNSRYELLAGERRWRAAQRAGLHELPAIVRDDLDDDQARVLGLVENLQRESLSPMETAEGLKRLADTFTLTHEQVGHRIGKSRAYVSNFLRLLVLDEHVREQIDKGELSLGHAKILCGLPASAQRRLGAVTAQDGLSVRALEKRAAAGTTNDKTPRARPIDADLARLERSLGEQLGYAVQLQTGAGGTGSLNIRFSNLDELDGLLARLGYDADA